MSAELRLWSVDIRMDRRALSPRRQSNYSQNIGVNIAAPDITTAIAGALDEIRERYDDVDMSKVEVYAANHKGIVNRIVSMRAEREEIVHTLALDKERP